MKRENMDKIKQLVEEIKKNLDIQIDDSPVKEVISLIEKGIKKNGVSAKVFLGGSFAKSTFIEKDFDCDIFLQFDKKYDENELSNLSEEILKRFNPVRIHGSRDYFNFEYKNIFFEVVPVYLIKKPSEASNITDVSPFHVTWFNEKRMKKPELAREVKVTKIFLKAQKLYGAESYIHGFSGHVVDILIAHYGSFINLIKNASEWKFPVIIDVENHYKNLDPILFLNKDKIKNEVIVVDPIVKERNAAAALSKENAIKFIQICKQFLEKPSKEFVEIKFLDLNSAKEKIGCNLGIIFEVTPLNEKSKDVAGTKAFKAFEFLVESLVKHDFLILDSFFDWNKKGNAFFYITFDKKELANEKVIIGPPNKKSFEKNISEFKSKYGDKVFLKDGKFCAKVRREITNPLKLVEKLVMNEKFTKNIKSFKMYKVNEN